MPVVVDSLDRGISLTYKLLESIIYVLSAVHMFNINTRYIDWKGKQIL